MRTSPCFFYALMIFLTASPPAGAAPIIAEFQAENKNTIKDADGDNPDWLEIFNPDPTPVDLAGLTLTDDVLVPKKWTLPAVTLATKSSLLVWCSGKDRSNPAAELHTNFDLDKAGGYLALLAADGTTKLTEWTAYPPQVEDRSYGTTRPMQTETLFPSRAPCRWLIPASDMPGWETPAYDDTGWTTALTGIGYDLETTYLTLFGTGGSVPAGTGSCYVRIPFNVTNAADILTMTLRMKFDDGFAAFLNGVRLNPPSANSTNAPDTLAFNSLATRAHIDTEALVFQPFDVSAQKSLLVNGPNVLAFQLLNLDPTSTDLLLVPELQTGKPVAGSPYHDGFFLVPSPGANNAADTVAGFVDAPDFSVKRGFYTAPVSVTLSSHTPGAQIRYTINGSAPTPTAGTIYTTPVAVSSPRVLRAVAYLTGWQTSPVKTHTYIFPAQVVTQPAAPAGFPVTWGNDYNYQTGQFNGPLIPADYRMDPGITNNAAYSSLMIPSLTTTLPILSIAGDVTPLFGTNGIYSNGRLTPGVELPVSMEFWTPSGTENWQENAGIRIHGGNAPFEHPKKPFRLYFRKEYGAGKLKQPLFPGSSVDSFDKLQLRGGGHDGWAVPFGSSSDILAYHATYIRDRFLRKTELDMGRLGTQGRYAHLYINGLYWGFYDIHEVVGKEFFSTHKGGEEDDWDVLEHSNVLDPIFAVVNGNGAAMDAALALVRPPENMADPAMVAQLETYIDFNEFIDHLIVQMWGGQNDWMGPVYRGDPENPLDVSRFFNKNWESGRRSRGEQPGQFLFQVWDAEISMGASLTTPFLATQRVADFNHTLIGQPGSISKAGPPAEIYYALRKYSPRFQTRFADRVQKQFFNDGAMTTARNQARLQALRDELNLPIVAESARWGDVNSGMPDIVTFHRDVHWRGEMDWLKDTYITGRNDLLLRQFRVIGLYPTTLAPVFSKFGGTVAAGYQLTITNPNETGGQIFYSLDGTDPMTPQVTTQVLWGPEKECRYKVPSFQYPANSWKDPAPPWNNGSAPNVPGPGGLTPAQEEATWKTGPAALGFDANPTFLPHIVTTVTGMRNTRPSIYIRIPFNITEEQKVTMTSLTLKLKYDDGAFLFLNGGTPVLQPNASGASPVYTDSANIARSDAEAVEFQSLDLTPYISRLVPGPENILAIQGLNVTAADDDFLCVPQLEASFRDSPYNGPVSLSQSGTVKSRVFKDGVWSGLTEASFIVGVPGSAANVTISEFSYNPLASPQEVAAGYTDQMFEFIELLNTSAGPVDLTACRFDDGIDFGFPVNSVIPAGQRILLVANEAAFHARHPGATIFGVFGARTNLANGGERIELVNAAGGHIFDFVYDDIAPWPESADGGGYTVVLINPSTHPDPSVPANWRSSAVPGGTPGADETGGGDTYAAWAARNAVTGQMTDDPDGNGLNNLAEYGFGLTPATRGTAAFSASLEPVTVGGVTATYLVIHYRRNPAAGDLTVTPEVSTDLQTWTPLTSEVTPPVANPDGSEAATRRSPLPVTGASEVFVRVKIAVR